MGAPITNFEIVESIRFFGALVSTPDVSENVKRKANIYLEKLVDSLEKSVTDTVASVSDIIRVGKIK